MFAKLETIFNFHQSLSIGKFKVDILIWINSITGKNEYGNITKKSHIIFFFSIIFWICPHTTAVVALFQFSPCLATCPAHFHFGEHIFPIMSLTFFLSLIHKLVFRSSSDIHISFFSIALWCTTTISLLFYVLTEWSISL